MDFLYLLTCIKYGYVVKYIREFLENRRKNMLKENIKNYDLEDLKIKLDELRRKKI